MDFQKIMDHFNSINTFVRHNGIKLTVMEPGYAETRVKVTPESLNFMGTVHGGILFSLADIAAACAFAAHQKKSVTLSCNITYLANVKAGELVARAREISCTRRIGTYEVEILNEADLLLCRASVVMYGKDDPNALPDLMKS